MTDHDDARPPAPGTPDPDLGSVGDAGAAVGRWEPTSERVALWTFIAFVVVAGPLLVFHYGEYHWFFRDDFEFITERAANGQPPWLEPHGGAHLSILPRAFFWVQWNLFGLTSYVPFQACVVALHLTAVVLIRVLMRRVGVGPWIASATAAIFVLFGPGSQNILWAFQVGFTGSVVYGLSQLLIADHDGPIGRRDLVALGFGVLAVASSGVGITTTVAVGVAVLLRRGWRAAALQTVPLGVLVGAWVLLFDAGSSSKDSASPGQLLGWLAESYRSTLDAFSASPVLASAIAGLALVGLVLRVRSSESIAAAVRDSGLVLGVLAGGLTFVVMTAWGRAATNPSALAASPRYVHILAVSLLPLVALGLQGLADRWNRTIPVLVLLLVATIPLNVKGFEPDVFGRPYMDERRRLLTTAPRVPFADEVAPWVQPVPDPYMGEMVTIGFLRGAVERGVLPEPPRAIGPRTQAEFRVRLGLAELPGDDQPETIPPCETISGPTRMSLDRGDRLAFGGNFTAAALLDDGQLGPSVSYAVNPFFPKTFEVQLPDLELEIAPQGHGVSVCPSP